MADKALSQLIYSDFDITNITVVKTDFADKNIVNYQEVGRRKNLLHMVTKGSRIYKTGTRTIELPCGSIILIPDNTEYKTISVAGDSDKVRGIGICFDMVDTDGEKIQLVRDIYCDFKVDISRTHEKFYLMDELYNTPLTPIFTLKTELGRLLHSLCSSIFTPSRELDDVKPALVFIAEHYRENLPVKTYSDKCNMSESNFRKKFQRSTGMSPIDYRNELRFEQARRLYRMNMSMQQIAEAVGFGDAQYLAKLYRRRTGSTVKKDTEIV